jgi:hypothetical protein
MTWQQNEEDSRSTTMIVVLQLSFPLHDASVALRSRFGPPVQRFLERVGSAVGDALDPFQHRQFTLSA